MIKCIIIEILKKVEFILNSLTGYWCGKTRFFRLASHLNNPRFASYINTNNEHKTIALTCVVTTQNGKETWNKLQSVINSTN